MALYVYPSTQVSVPGVATENTQLQVLAEVTSLDAKDFATQTTLANLNSKVTAVNTGAVTVASSALPTGAATQLTLFSVQTSLNALSQKAATGIINVAYDTINITYVTSGNGIGEIQTVVYSQGGTPVATLTLSYDANNKLISVVKT